MKIHTMFINRRFNGVKICILPKLTFNFMSIKIHYEVFVKVDRV